MYASAKLRQLFCFALVMVVKEITVDEAHLMIIPVFLSLSANKPNILVKIKDVIIKSYAYIGIRT